jgi:acylphosphatase
MINRKVTITGKVQGVSFRKATFEMALRLGVFGNVKNVDHDKVFLEAEGDSDTVFKLIDFCHHGPEHAEVEHVSIQMGEIMNYTSFDILYVK